MATETMAYSHSEGALVAQVQWLFRVLDIVIDDCIDQTLYWVHNARSTMLGRY